MVAAETGSGKTHGYLIPVIQRLNSMQSASKNALDDAKLKKHRHISLVLCPNAMLCEQVVRMANTLCDNAGEPILKTAAICGRQVWNETVFSYLSLFDALEVLFSNITWIPMLTAGMAG